jgi:SAM-dependent methyltransferase
MCSSKIIKIKPDSEYNKLMLSEKEEYYKNIEADFFSSYTTIDGKLERCEPTTPRAIFFEIFNKIVIDKDWIFLDCGCGLGHAMYLASFFFDKIYGVEYIPRIVRICKKNLNLIMPKNKTYKIYHCNMFDIDKSVLNEINVFYVSSPFIDIGMFDRLICMIRESILNRDREAWIIYFYPHCESVMEKYSKIFPLELTFKSIGKVNYYHHKEGVYFG